MDFLWSSKTENIMTGRPSLYSETLTTEICRRLAGGESLRSVCRSDEMPDITTIYDWLRKYETFAKQYARATEDRADAVFEEMFEIADDGQNDYMERETGMPALNAEHVMRSRLRIDTRKWALARMNPRKYGDKTALELTGRDGAPVEINATLSAKEAADAWKRMVEGK
jgi:hypothetical protein